MPSVHQQKVKQPLNLLLYKLNLNKRGMWQILVVILLALIHGTANACKPAPGYTKFSPGIQDKNQSHSLAIPKANLALIKRGYDDGNGGSCSENGVIKIQFDNENPVETTGYRLKVLSGSVFGNYIIPDFPVMPRRDNFEENALYFTWYDGGTKIREKIDLVLQIIAVSPAGEESEPYLLSIQHSGGKLNE